MRSVCFLVVLVMSWLITSAYAQLSHTFTKIADINDGGRAYDVVQAADGTIFLANGGDGLRSYSYDGTSFTNIAHINDGDSALGVAVASDSLIFLADGGDGLRAYSYDGTSFSNTAHIDNGGLAEAVAVAGDGTIFLANDFGGLRAYTYDGTSFINTAHVNDGGTAEELAFALDGTLFLASTQDGVRAYTYDGAAFINTAHIYRSDNVAWEVFVSSDGSVFVGDIEALRVYTFQDTAYAEVTHLDLNDWPQDFAVVDNTIFVACRNSIFSYGSLQAYTYDGATLTKTAHLDEDINGSDIDGYGVTIASDGTILLANDSEGLFAYSYGPVTGIENNSSPVPDYYTLEQNYPNPFNPSTTIKFTLSKSAVVTIKMFDIAGRAVAILVNNERLGPGTHQRVFDAAHLASGVYFYQMKAGAPSTGSGPNYEQTRKLILLQ